MIDIANSAEYTECIRQINLWYGSDAQKIIDIANQYELTPAQLSEDWLSGSGFEPWYTSSHGIAGYNSVGTSGINYATQMEQTANSNAGSVTQVQLKTPVETAINQQTGKVEVSKGLTSVATGTKSALTFVTKEVLPAMSAAGLGIALGKKFDAALYNAFPDFWDNIGMSTLNPETWNNITQDYPDGFLKKAFNTIFGLNPSTGETQQYLDADAAAYLAQYMQEMGVFSQSADTTSITAEVRQRLFDTNIPLSYSTGASYDIINATTYGGSTFFTGNVTCTEGSCILTPIFIGNSASTLYTRLVIVCASESPFKIKWSFNGLSPTYTSTSAYMNGKSYYYYDISYRSNGYEPLTESLPHTNLSYTPTDYNDTMQSIAYAILYGTTTPGQSIEGISNQDGATLPNFTGCETPEDYLQALQTQYPDLFNNAVTQSVVNPDGTTQTKTYIPIGTPSKNNNGNKTQPVTNNNNSGNTQDDSKSNPNTTDLTGLENLIKTLTDTISKTGTPTNPTNPDPTGTGNTPPVIAPTGNASALWSVYNPSQAELNSFGAWLWSSNFIDQILKLFNNPMQSIIGVHKIFASPPVSGSGSITVGYLNSGVSANLVSGQYTTVNCGTVKVREQFGNVFDYTDTHVRLYLPFIGIVDLDTADVMRGNVSVVYHVDVITGACLAEVKVARDGSGGTLYQYAGDAAVRYPISSGSYMGVVAGIASAVGGVASAVMTGGATLPLAAGAVAGGISGAQTQVQHSGNFSGNAGAMGGKKPYIIIERPQTMIADDFEHYQGKGANARRTVGQMNGYFKFSDVHTDSISGAAQSEIEAIRAALESGVIA